MHDVTALPLCHFPPISSLRHLPHSPAASQTTSQSLRFTVIPSYPTFMALMILLSPSPVAPATATWVSLSPSSPFRPVLIHTLIASFFFFQPSVFPQQCVSSSLTIFFFFFLVPIFLPPLLHPFYKSLPSFFLTFSLPSFFSSPYSPSYLPSSLTSPFYLLPFSISSSLPSVPPLFLPYFSFSSSFPLFPLPPELPLPSPRDRGKAEVGMNVIRTASASVWWNGRICVQITRP